MFEVKNANKELLDSLQLNKTNRRAKNSRIVYGILKTLGILGTGVALFNFGVVGGIVATGCSLFFVGCAFVSKVMDKEALDNENDKKVVLSVELASKLGKSIDVKSFQPELVATLDNTEKATFTQNGEEITYGDKGEKKYYYKYTDGEGNNHLLEETTNYYEDKQLMSFSNVCGFGGYTTKIRTSHCVNGLEACDEDALPKEVVDQIIKYEADKINEQTNPKGLRRLLRK